MKIPAAITSIRQMSATTKCFTLDLAGENFSFLAGQWVDCYVEIEGRWEVAGYSMTSSPLAEGSIDLAVKLVGDNPVTHFMHKQARVGDLLHLEGPGGEFYFRRGMADSLVLVGGGIGITPLMSIVRYVDEAAPEVVVTLAYSARTPSELLFGDELTQIAGRNPRVRCLFTVTQPGAEPWDGRVGRIDAKMLAGARPDLDALFYACGPPALVADVTAFLGGLGVPAPRIMTEKW